MKHALYMTVLLLLPFAAGAQDHSVSDQAEVETGLSETLWFQSSNAAGLAFGPLPVFNTVGLGYGLRSGDFHTVQEGKDTGDVSFDTQGALAVDRVHLWGHFRYDHITTRAALANTVLYDPSDEREVFGVADAVPSGWKCQAYDMEFKAAVPMGGNWSAGLHLHYVDRIGAKQEDPRSETFKYSIDVRPSLACKVGESSFGLAAIYANMFERSVPTLSNASEIQPVYVMRGMGNFTLDMVGSNGLQTLFYRCNSFGGAIQYGHGSGLLAEVGVMYHGTDATESATQPFRLGSTSMLEMTGSLQWLAAGGKFNAEVLHRKTDGTEYSQVYNLSTGEYEVRTSAVTSSYATLSAAAGYDRYIGGNTRSSYVWKWGVKAGWEHKRDEYLLPQSLFSYDNLLVSADAFRRIRKDGKRIRLGVLAAYNLNLGGEYSYSGSFATDIPATEWYPHDNAILTSDYLAGGLSVDISVPLKPVRGTNLLIGASVHEILSSGHGNRTTASLELGLIF